MLIGTRSLECLVVLAASLAAKSVLGQSCGWSWTPTCNLGKICCNNQCVYGSDCYGESCVIDSDCGYDGLNCCDGTCRYSCVDDTVPALIGGLVGVGIFIAIISAIIYFCCCRRPVQPNTGRVVTQGERRVITTTTTNYVNPPQPAPYNLPPAPYHQPPRATNYAAPPPGHYGYGAIDPRPGGYDPPPQYQPPGAQASFAPPPYTETAQPVKNSSGKPLEPSAPPM